MVFSGYIKVTRSKKRIYLYQRKCVWICGQKPRC